MISLVGTPGALAQANAASVTPAFGTGQTRASGNLLTLQVTARGTNPIGTPAGWTAALTEAVNGFTRCQTFYRVATGGDAAPAVTATAATRITAQVNEWTRAAASPLDTAGSGNGTNEVMWTARAAAAPSTYGGLALATWSSHAASATAIILSTNIDWTQINNDMADASLSDHASMEYKLNPEITGNPTTAAVTPDTVQANWTGQIVIFKALAGFLTVGETAQTIDIAKPTYGVSWIGPAVSTDWKPRSPSESPYTYYFVNLKDWTILDTLPLTTVKFSTRISQPGSWSAHIDLNDEELVDPDWVAQVTVPEITGIFIDRSGTLVYAGIIYGRKNDDLTGAMTLSGSDFLSYIHDRVIEETLTFTNWDQIDIFKYMVDYCQGVPIVYSNGTASAKPNCLTGLVCYGSSSSGNVRSKIWNWFDFQFVGPELEKFAMVLNGFEYRSAPYWGVIGGDTGDPATSTAPRRVPVPGIKIGYPTLGARSSPNDTDLIWTFPQGPLFKMPWEEDASRGAKYVFATGSGSDASKLFSRSPASGPPEFPRRDYIANFGQEKDVNVLQAYGDLIQRNLGQFLINPQTQVLGFEDPTLTQYEDGDHVRYIVPPRVANRFPNGLDVTLRLVGRDVTINEDGSDIVTHITQPPGYIDVAYDLNGNSINLTGR